jgi:ParB family chromosome partitioning protein
MTGPRKPKPLEQVEPDPNLKAAIEHLERVLGTRVRVVEKSPQRGRIEIDYYSLEDLQRIYEIIIGDK